MKAAMSASSPPANDAEQFRLLNAGDGSLMRWEGQHACPDLPKNPPKFTIEA
jgi:hypothetical protein